MSKVRNVRSIGGTKPIPVTHFIPPQFAPVYKIEVVTDTETIDLTERIARGELSDGVTDKIGEFTFLIIDPDNEMSGRIEEFDTFNVYLDYGTTATTKRFSGKIERKSNVEQVFLELSGRSIAMIATGKNIIYSSDGPKARSTIIKEIISENFPGLISTAGVEDDEGLSDVNYGEIPFWQVITELCASAGYDAYINTSSVFQYFVSGSRKSSTEAIVESINLLDASDFAKDTEGIVTQVRVYGDNDGGVPIISSSVRDTTQTKGIAKEVRKDVGDIKTVEQAASLATDTASANLNAPTLGTLSSLLLPTLLPGEQIKIANPTNNIAPEYYEINSYKHVFPEGGVPMTVVKIKKERVDMFKVLRRNYNFQHEITSNDNPLNLDYSLIYDYNLNYGLRRFSLGTFDNVGVQVSSNGSAVLRTQSGDSGTWTSEEVSLPSTPAGNMELRYKATDYGLTKVFISLDRGITFIEINSVAGSLTFGSAQNSIIIRVNFSSANTRIEKIGILYSL